MGERIFTQGTPAPACSVDPRTSRAPALRGPGRAGGGGRAAAAGLLGGPPAAAPIGCAAAPCSRRVPPATRPASSRPQPRSWFLQEGGRAGAGPVSSLRTRAGAREDKTLGGLREPRVRQPPERGEAGPVPPAARASAPRTRLPERGAQRARAHATARAPRLYLQLSNEESPGESTGAAGDVSCARGCCCRRGCLKLPKLRASERLPPAGSSRERNSEDARVTAKDRTDARTFGRHHRRRPIPRALKAPQFCELCSGLVAC